MKLLSAPLVLGTFGLLLAVGSAGAQVAPFNSTSPASPFNRFNSPNAPGGVQPNGQSGSSQQGSGQNMPTVMPGYPVQAMSMSGAGSIDPNHRLTRQDRLTLLVAEDPDAKVAELTVQDSGDVVVPLIGTVKAAGKTTAQLSGDIKARLESEYYYHATVSLGLSQIAQHSNGRVFITGETNNKGALDLPSEGQLTVSQAILQMGGPTIDANLKKVQVNHKDARKGQAVIVDIKAVISGETDKDVILQPGDTVVVPKAFLGIRF